MTESFPVAGPGAGERRELTRTAAAKTEELVLLIRASIRRTRQTLRGCDKASGRNYNTCDSVVLGLMVMSYFGSAAEVQHNHQAENDGVAGIVIPAARLVGNASAKRR